MLPIIPKQPIIKVQKNSLAFLWPALFALCFLSAEAKDTKIKYQVYLDQAIHRKKNLISERCFKIDGQKNKGFMMVEIKAFRSGKIKSRIIGTEIENKNSLKCTLSILNRVRLKKLKQAPIIRIYRFFIL